MKQPWIFIPPQKLSVIEESVCDVWGCSMDQVAHIKKYRHAIQARKVIMYLYARHSNMSYETICSRLKFRNSTLITVARSDVDFLLRKDVEFRYRFDQVYDKIKSKSYGN